MPSDFKLSEEDTARLRSNFDDLKIQSMMFDMDIDYETASLTPHIKDTSPTWLKRWGEKRRAADLDEYTDMDRE